MYLGIDLGTSAIKALLMDAEQNVVGSASSNLSVSRPHPGWSEQDPSAWIIAAEDALNQLAGNYRKQLAAVRGIGLSGQMHGATVLDDSDTVLRPCILWNDTRSHAEAARLDGEAAFRKQTGNIVFPGFTAPKLAWLKLHEPAIFGRVAKVLLPKDYLRLWLTGEHVAEMSDAAGTAWLDVASRSWSGELLAATDLGPQHMGRLVEGTEASGELRAELASRWAMGRNVVVAGGAGDNAATACGMGTIRAGDAFLSLGTSGVLFAANADYRPRPESAVHTFCHALPATWHQMGVILSATDSLNWLARLTGKSAAELAESVGETLHGPGPTVFLPYLGGERTPHNDAETRGALVGLDHASDATTLCRAVLEGVTFAFRDNLEALASTGTSLSRATAVGGGVRSHYWLQLLATVLDLPIEVPRDGDFGAAFGAARLGLVAAEQADPAATFTAPPSAMTVQPEASLSDRYAQAYQRYRALYPPIKRATEGVKSSII